MLNVLVIVTDEERSWQYLPSDLRLPGREFLRSTGTNFTQFHVAATPCSPSRATLWTGRHTPDNGVFCIPRISQDLADSGVPTLAHYLKDLGYHTALKGKWNSSEITPGPTGSYWQSLRVFGFDEYQEESDVVGLPLQGAEHDGDIADRAIDFLKRQKERSDSSRPWFLAVNFINPHDVMWFDATGNQSVEAAVSQAGYEMNSTPNRSPYTNRSIQDLPGNVGHPFTAATSVQRNYRTVTDYRFGSIDPTDVSAFHALNEFYLNSIKENDGHLHRLLSAAYDAGHLDDTIVVFTSDHGELCGAHGLRGKDATFYDEAIRVPLMIRMPYASICPKEAPVLCSSIDVVPTILDAVGSAKPEELPGVSLTRYCSGTSPEDVCPESDRAIALFYGSPGATSPEKARVRMEKMREANRSGVPAELKWPDDFVDDNVRTVGRAIHDGQYKFARWSRAGERTTPLDWRALAERFELEVYDIKNDPLEMTNLAASSKSITEHFEIIDRLNSCLNDLIKREVVNPDQFPWSK